MQYISVKNLHFYYDKDPVLEDVNFSIENGEFVTLTGENGAAKTTLVKLILGILKAKSGEILLSNTNTKGEDLTISYLPQQISSFNSGFPSTVFEFVKSGLFRKNTWFHKFTKEDVVLIEENLKTVGMWDKRNSKIGELSGGQKQRVIIARMLMSDSDILILDEPTTGMDEKTRNNFYELLKNIISEKNNSILIITHDNDVVENYADKNIHLCKSDTNSWCCKFMVKNKKGEHIC